MHVLLPSPPGARVPAAPLRGARGGRASKAATTIASLAPPGRRALQHAQLSARALSSASSPSPSSWPIRRRMHANGVSSNTSSPTRRPSVRARAAADDGNANNPGLQAMDDNQLQTALTAAIDGEDYALAARIRDVLRQRTGGTALSSSSRDDGSDAETADQPPGNGSNDLLLPLDWRALGIPDWLADRAERLGLRYPTVVQRRASPVVADGCDAVVSSVTGSGKTAAFLLPALARLPYPPDLEADDLDGPALLIVVPTFELGAQAALLTYRLLGGSISARRPGDPGNMFSYAGPRGIRVRGLLTRDEVEAARRDPVGYLRGVHVVVATPDCALAAASEDGGGAAWQLQAAAAAAAAVLGEGSAGFDDEGVDEDDEEGGRASGFSSSPDGSGGDGGDNDDDSKWRLPPLSDAASGKPPASSSGEVDSASAYQIATGRSVGSGGTRRRRAAGGEGSGSSNSASSNSGLGGLSRDAQMSPLLAALEAMKAARDGGVGKDGASAAAAAARAARLREESELDKAAEAAAAAAAAAGGAGGGANAGGNQNNSPPLQLHDLCVVVVDEVDACAQGYPASFGELMDRVCREGGGVVAATGAAAAAAEAAAAAAADPSPSLLPQHKPQVVLVGATISDAETRLALERRWLSPDFVRVAVGGGGSGGGGGSTSCPAGLRHRAIVVPDEKRRLSTLVRLLRRDFDDAADAAAAAEAAGTAGTGAGGPLIGGPGASPAAAEAATTGAAPPPLDATPPSDALLAAAAASSSGPLAPPPPRVIVFARSEQEAKKAAEPLRAALWREHRLSVLLPSGEAPVRALHAFRDRAASLLLATPQAARGLDLPAVSAVYCLGPPPSAAEYAHRAGRAGRVGSAVPGARVTSVVTPSELALLLEAAKGVGLRAEAVEVVDESDERLGLAPLMPESASSSAGAQEGGEGEGGGAAAAAAAGGDGKEGGNEAERERLESLRRGLDDLYNLM